MGLICSSCNKENQYVHEQKDSAVDMVDRDGKTYLQYIMNYNSIPYFIPKIKYAKVTDIRENYTIVVAARLPFKDSPIYRFPIKLNYICNETVSYHIPQGFESNLDRKAVTALFPLICSSIVELRDVENYNGTLYADVYFNNGDKLVPTSVSEWLVTNNLAIDADNKYYSYNRNIF